MKIWLEETYKLSGVAIDYAWMGLINLWIYR
jgi:hypothetical protein